MVSGLRPSCAPRLSWVSCSQKGCVAAGTDREACRAVGSIGSGERDGGGEHSVDIEQTVGPVLNADDVVPRSHGERSSFRGADVTSSVAQSELPFAGTRLIENIPRTSGS